MKRPDLITSFLEYKKVEVGLATSTLAKYRHVLKALFKHRRLKATAIPNENDVRRYLASRRKRGVCAKTIAQETTCLREFFRHLQRDRYLTESPMRRIPIPKVPKCLPKPISKAQCNSLMDLQHVSGGAFEAALELRNRAICETLYASAIRVCELCSARLQDLKGRTLLVFGKGSKQRLAPLGNAAILAIADYLRLARPVLVRESSSPFLFVGRRDQALSRQAINQMLKKRAQQAGISHVSPHTLRHSCATHMVDNGADLRTVQTILGHSDISTTEIYTQVSREHLRAVLFRCHPRWKPRNQIEMFQPENALPKERVR